MKFFADLQMAIRSTRAPDTYESMAAEGITVIYEEPEDEEGADAGE